MPAVGAAMKSCLKEMLAAGAFLFCVNWGAYGGVVVVVALDYQFPILRQVPPGAAMLIGFVVGGIGGVFIGHKVLALIGHGAEDERD